MPFCEKCGMELKEGNKFCTQCGQPVPTSIGVAQLKEGALQGTSAAEEEQYLGGFTSAELKPRGRGAKMLIGGCGLYATNKRIIIIRSKKGFVQFIGALGGATLIVAAAASKISNSAKTIAELEKKKAFEILKGNITEINMISTKRYRLGAYLDFTLKSGEHVNFFTAYKDEFNKLKDLMNVFYPERLKVEEGIRKRLDKPWKTISENA